MVSGRDVAIGLLVGSAALFAYELSPMLKDPSLRMPLEPEPYEQSDVDAFMSSVIGFAAMGVTMWWTFEVIADPKELSW